MKLKTKLKLFLKGKRYKEIVNEIKYSTGVKEDKIISYLDNVLTRVPGLPDKEDEWRFVTVVHYFMEIDRVRPDLYEMDYKSLSNICVAYNKGATIEALEKKLFNMRRKAFFIVVDNGDK